MQKLNKIIMNKKLNIPEGIFERLSEEHMFVVRGGFTSENVINDGKKCSAINSSKKCDVINNDKYCTAINSNGNCELINNKKDCTTINSEPTPQPPASTDQQNPKS